LARDREYGKEAGNCIDKAGGGITFKQGPLHDLFSFHAAMEPELSKLVALERNPKESKTNRRCYGHLYCVLQKKRKQ